MNREQVAEYIADMAKGLTRMAQSVRLGDLVYLLQMVAEEAENSTSRESG